MFVLKRIERVHDAPCKPTDFLHKPKTMQSYELENTSSAERKANHETETHICEQKEQEFPINMKKLEIVNWKILKRCWLIRDCGYKYILLILRN